MNVVGHHREGGDLHAEEPGEVFLNTDAREIRKSKRSRSNSTTPRVELWQMNTKPNTVELGASVHWFQSGSST